MTSERRGLERPGVGCDCRPSKTAGLMMKFDGGMLDDAVPSRFRLAQDELAAWS